MSALLRHLIGLPLLALATAGCWWGWLAWDSTYQIDPDTGVASGPYEAWQVIGCVLCLIVLGLIAASLLHPVAVCLVMPPAFTLAWSVTAASEDESGLWAVGAIMVLIGMCAVTPVIAWLGHLIGRRLRPAPAAS